MLGSTLLATDEPAARPAHETCKGNLGAAIAVGELAPFRLTLCYVLSLYGAVSSLLKYVVESRKLAPPSCLTLLFFRILAPFSGGFRLGRRIVATGLNRHYRRVKFYSCGPTVYDMAHIGNFRAFLTYDVLKRWLVYQG